MPASNDPFVMSDDQIERLASFLGVEVTVKDGVAEVSQDPNLFGDAPDEGDVDE